MNLYVDKKLMQKSRDQRFKGLLTRELFAVFSSWRAPGGASDGYR